MIEIGGDVLALLLHAHELRQYLQVDIDYLPEGQKRQEDMLFITSVIVDFSELLMAALSLFTFLLPALEGFSALYDAMANEPVESSVDPMPCIYTRCMLDGGCG